MNVVSIIGNVVSDPDSRETGEGKAVCIFNIAYTSPFGKKETSFFRCVSFEKTAEIIQKIIRKGNRVGITGELKQETWMNNDQKMSIISIVVRNIDNLTNKQYDGKVDIYTGPDPKHYKKE